LPPAQTCFYCLCRIALLSCLHSPISLPRSFPHILATLLTFSSFLVLVFHFQVGESGGGRLYSDQAGRFTHCNRNPATCGAQGPVYYPWQPHHLFWTGPGLRQGVENARGDELGAAMWEASATVVGKEYVVL
jgi:hypothetical protein